MHDQRGLRNEHVSCARRLQRYAELFWHLSSENLDDVLAGALLVRVLVFG